MNEPASSGHVERKSKSENTDLIILTTKNLLGRQFRCPGLSGAHPRNRHGHGEQPRRRVRPQESGHCIRAAICVHHGRGELCAQSLRQGLRVRPHVRLQRPLDDDEGTLVGSSGMMPFSAVVSFTNLCNIYCEADHFLVSICI